MDVDGHVGIHRFQQFTRGFALAPQGAGHHAGEPQVATGEVFAQPARLLAAKVGQTIIVGGAERSLAVPDEKDECHG